MTPTKIKCGIEIHQQLEGQKLFCDCPTQLRDDTPDFTIKRKLRAVAGESGNVDVAAAQEQSRDLTFIYEGYHDTTCLVEADCEPPHELNKDALYTALQFCKLVNSKVYPIVQVMRKTVVDGSNTSGFQRTALIARGGVIATGSGEVHIDNISLEEDACKNVSEGSVERVWRLDRLGIPLVEIGTAPDITSPEQCLETAKKIGYLLRSLPGVKRGLGTIRQDVNVSIEGGNRVEIKGAQDLKMLSTWVELEAQRQQKLIDIHNQLKDLKFNQEDKSIVELNAIFSKTESKLIKNVLDKKGKILGARVPHLAGILGKEVQPNRRFGTEMSDYAKVFGVGGMIHSDEDLNKYKFSTVEIEQIRTQLKVTDKDGFIIIADNEEKARKAIAAALRRAEMQFKLAVPKEVRKANPDGTTSYMRPMPGAARMYPETDVPLVKPDLRKVEVPETLEQKFARYQKEYGLSKDLAEFIAKSEYMQLFEEAVKKYKSIKPAFVAETISSAPQEAKKKHEIDADKVNEEHFHQLFKLINENRLQKNNISDALAEMIQNKFDPQKYQTVSTDEVHKVVKEIVTKNPAAPFGALVGLCMKALGGKASGQVISAELKKLGKQ